MKIMLRAGIIAIVAAPAIQLSAQSLTGYSYKNAFDPANAVVNTTQFNGYTNHWQDKYKKWIRYGNLYKISMPDLAPSIAQSKIDIAEDMKLPGLQLQEGFVSGLMAAPYAILQNPTGEQLEKAIGNGNTLVVLDSVYATAQLLTAKLPPDTAWGIKLKSHQYQAPGFAATRAFILGSASGKLFVIAAPNKAAAQQLLQWLNNTAEILKAYDLHKGWFGAETLLKSVTCTQGHPLELIGRGMNEGNDWFTFSGYMDFLMKDELEGWMQKAGNPVVTDVGFSPIYGLNNYHGLQVQDMGGKDNWINFAHKNGGYAFRPVYDPPSNAYQFDGYLAGEGNKEQIDNENIPFVASTGTLSEDALTSMVLFTKKGEPFTKATMWQAILQRKEVAVLAEGKMMGPAYFRNALQLLLLDRFFLEDYFGDRLDLQANTEGYTLQLVITNNDNKAVSGTLAIQLPPELQWTTAFTATAISMPANSTKTIQLYLRPNAAGMDKTNPILVSYTWGGKTKRTLAMLNMPVAISAHHLLYGHAPVVQYPVSVHNFTTETNFPVQVQVFEKGKNGKTRFYQHPTITSGYRHLRKNGV